MSEGGLDGVLRWLSPGILGHRFHIELVRPRGHLLLVVSVAGFVVELDEGRAPRLRPMRRETRPGGIVSLPPLTGDLRGTGWSSANRNHCLSMTRLLRARKSNTIYASLALDYERPVRPRRVCSLLVVAVDARTDLRRSVEADRAMTPACGVTVISSRPRSAVVASAGHR
jgi:hypothetical protein